MENTRRKRVTKDRKRKIRQLLKCVTVRRGFWRDDLFPRLFTYLPLFARSILFTMDRAFARRRLYKLHVFEGAPSVVVSRLVDHRQAGMFRVDITYGYLIFDECILISKLRIKRYSR